MEIRILARDPGDEPGKFLMPEQGFGSGIASLELLVAESGVNGAMTDRVNRLRMSATTAFRHRMMPFDPPPERTAA
jgi:hypothetical protein